MVRLILHRQTWLNQNVNRRSLRYIAASLLLLMVGCDKKDDQIQTYRVSKETGGPAMPMAGGPMGGGPMAGGPMPGSSAPPSPAPSGAPSAPPFVSGNSGAPGGSDMQSMGAGMGLAPAAGPHEVSWKLPQGWKEQPPSQMRVGSFLAKGSDGQPVDISIVPLGGDAGGDLANVNRWRGQINLDPISDADLAQNSEHITPGGRAMLLVDFVSKDLEIDNKYPKRLVAATYKQGSRSWFFKMTGEDKAVSEVKPAFLQFLKSIKFNGGE